MAKLRAGFLRVLFAFGRQGDQGVADDQHAYEGQPSQISAVAKLSKLGRNDINRAGSADWRRYR